MSDGLKTKIADFVAEQVSKPDHPIKGIHVFNR
jgi:hypothetical protein